MRFHNTASNGQPQSGSGFLGRKIGFEDMGPVIRRDHQVHVVVATRLSGPLSTGSGCPFDRLRIRDDKTRIRTFAIRPPAAPIAPFKGGIDFGLETEEDNGRGRF